MLPDCPQFDNLLTSLKKGDTLVVWKLDRLGRSMIDLVKIIAEMDAKGVHFVSLTENINTDSTTGKMMLMLFSIMAEYELSIKKERQEANKEIARQSGKLGGRPKGLSREAKKNSRDSERYVPEERGSRLQIFRFLRVPRNCQF